MCKECGRDDRDVIGLYTKEIEKGQACNLLVQHNYFTLIPKVQRFMLRCLAINKLDMHLERTYTGVQSRQRNYCMYFVCTYSL